MPATGAKSSQQSYTGVNYRTLPWHNSDTIVLEATKSLLTNSEATPDDETHAWPRSCA